MRFFRALRLILTIKCEKSAMLTSESFDRRLTFSERFAVGFHQAYCRKSRRLAAQLSMLEVKCCEMRGQISNRPDCELAPETAERIRASIRERTGEK